MRERSNNFATIKANNHKSDTTMRRIQFFILSLAVAITATAATFTGTVVDEAGQPFAFANVVLLNPIDSAFVSGTTTDDAGAFSLTSEKSSVIVKISYIGYETKCVNATAGNMGTIQLQPEATMLGEVVVKGARPTYKLTTEGIKTDVDGTLLSKVGTATEVLGNLPGVQKKGTSVEVFGKGTPLIYINGREMRNESELAQLSSENIQSVELITNPGAKYDAQVESVILIKTCRQQGEGWSGDVQSHYRQGYNPDLDLGLIRPRIGPELELSPQGAGRVWQRVVQRRPLQERGDSHFRRECRQAVAPRRSLFQPSPFQFALLLLGSQLHLQ